ncbi:type 1 glutamine amidotransferase domain-containing protein [Aeromicrobium sp. CF3.5]|uniref:type 1 glutamine amidotransferase domain-containing protein n=1 Tax=Aeromicrobium sp. CF3.5 TaxID=3373078 RepID=UPI003EE4CC4F
MKIAIITSNTGVEKAELEAPTAAITDAGWEVEHLAPEVGDVQTMVADVDKDAVHQATRSIAEASVSDYDGLVIPGGTVNADHLRLDDDALALITAFVDAGKPIAAICHAPWVLVEAGVLPGKTLTSFPSLRTDITNAKGSWVDEEVKHCPANDWDLITSRTPDDLEAFTSTFVEVFGR